MMGSYVVMSFSCSPHLDLHGFFFFFLNKSCLLTKIALSNGYDTLYMEGTNVICNQGMMAYAILRTFCGDEHEA